MLRSIISRRLALYIVSLAVLNGFGSYLHWYESLWWYDMPMHFLGGVCVFYVGVIVALPFLPRLGLKRFMALSVTLGLAMGLGWEAFEYYLYAHGGVILFIPLDSISDVCFDLAGIFVAARSAASIFTAAENVSNASGS